MNREQLEAYKRAMKTYNRYDDTSWKTQKEVYCPEKDEEYPSISAASRATGVNRRLIVKCCEGKQKSSQGYSFYYVE